MPSEHTADTYRKLNAPGTRQPVSPARTLGLLREKQAAPPTLLSSLTFLIHPHRSASPSPILAPFWGIAFWSRLYNNGTCGFYAQCRQRGFVIDQPISRCLLISHPAVCRVRVSGRLNPDRPDPLQGMMMSTVEGERHATVKALPGVLEHLYNGGVPLLGVEWASAEPPSLFQGKLSAWPTPFHTLALVPPQSDTITEFS